jgi:hypothetical protein
MYHRSRPEIDHMAELTGKPAEQIVAAKRAAE